MLKIKNQYTVKLNYGLQMALHCFSQESEKNGRERKKKMKEKENTGKLRNEEKKEGERSSMTESSPYCLVA